MKTLKFKTNINCGGCVSKVAPFLNEQSGVKNWGVDIANPDKILTIVSNDLSEKEIKTALNKIGFNAETLKAL